MSVNAATGEDQSHQGWTKLSLAVMGFGLSVLVASGLVAALAFSGVLGEASAGPGTTTVFGNDLSFLQEPQPSPTEASTPPSEAPIARIAIPRFDVDAPAVIRGVDDNRVMETPDGPLDVAWYDFSARPGFGSNAVFSGHVDYINHGPAVFWNLKDLNEGDIVEVSLEDGTVYKYRVFNRDQVSANPPEDVLQEIVGPTQQEIVTLITCGGSFDGVGYDQRVIVRAQRIIDPAPAASVPGS